MKAVFACQRQEPKPSPSLPPSPNPQPSDPFADTIKFLQAAIDNLDKRHAEFIAANNSNAGANKLVFAGNALGYDNGNNNNGTSNKDVLDDDNGNPLEDIDGNPLDSDNVDNDNTTTNKDDQPDVNNNEPIDNNNNNDYYDHNNRRHNNTDGHDDDKDNGYDETGYNNK